LKPGAFRTPASIIHALVHPAYIDASLATSILRKAIPDAVFPGDADKVTKVIYELFGGEAENLPLRIPLGKDTIQALRSQIKQLTTDGDGVEKYSDDLVHG
jgi:hypothetical protein